MKVLPNAKDIALKVAAGMPLDYITLTYGRRAGTQMRYWPWLALELGDEPGDYDWPVKDQKVVIEQTCHGVTPRHTEDLVEALQRHGVGTIIVLAKYSTQAEIIDRTRVKTLSRTKALALLARERQQFYAHLPLDDEERQLMLALSHDGLQTLVRHARQHEEAA